MLKVLLDQLVHKVQLDLQVLRVLRVLQDLQVHKVLKVLQEP